MKRREFLKIMLLLPFYKYFTNAQPAQTMKKMCNSQFVFDGVNGLTFLPTKKYKVTFPMFMKWGEK